jgi:hypothetical protein
MSVASRTQCAEKVRLSEAVVKAVRLIYDAKSPVEHAKARVGERAAAKALDAHRKEHGC